MYVGYPDPLAFLHSKDALEKTVLIEVARRAAKLIDQRDENMAVRIANEVSKTFKKA